MMENLEKIEKMRDIEKRVSNKYSELERIENLAGNEQENEKSSKKAFEYAIRILSQRDYSTHKMKEKLKLRGFEKEIRDEVVHRLIDMKYLKDDEFTKMRIKQLLVKGYANKYILQKLQAEELQSNDNEIDDLRVKNEMNTEVQIEYLISKKLRSQKVPKEFNSKMKLKQKITNFLISKGYDFESINTHLSPYFK